VLTAKPGLDGHNRGIHVVNRALRDAGMEVIYLGVRREPEEIARAAVQEDVDVVGLSILSGAHMQLIPATLSALVGVGGNDIPVVVGGIIPDDDVEELLAKGVAAVFHPGDPLGDIVNRVQEIAQTKRAIQKGDG